MTEETRKLFGAPWAVDERPSETFGEVFDVMDEDLYLHYARCYDEKTANRLARLPELYDGLMEALEIICGIPGEDACDHCSNVSIDLGGPCRIREWRELLRKVRAGE